MKPFLGRSNSLKPPVFGFCDSLPYDLEESIKLRALICGVLGLQAFKNAKKNWPKFFVFLSCHYGFTNYFDIIIFLFSIIPRQVSTC